jgi:hypothetical protein
MPTYEEDLLREVIALEIRTYYSHHPTTTEMIVREGLSDFLGKVKDVGMKMAKKFSDGWEAVTSTVKGMIDTIKEASIEKVKSAFEKLKQIYEDVKSKFGAFFSSPEVKGFISKNLKDELHLAHEISDANKGEDAPCAKLAINAMTAKAKATDGHIKEGRLMGGADHRAIALLESEIRAGGLRKRQALNEGLLPDPVSYFLLALGGLPLMFKGLEKAFDYLANKSCSTWAKKAAKYSEALYNYFHHKEEAFIDLIPNSIAASFYAVYIKAGGDPFPEAEGGAVVHESYQLAEFFWGKKKEENPAATDTTKRGKFGSSTDVTAKTLEANKPLRMKIKKAMYHFLVLILLFDGVYTIFKKGFSAFYAFKSGVKTAELGVGRGAEAAAEFGVAARAARAAV